MPLILRMISNSLISNSHKIYEDAKEKLSIGIYKLLRKYSDYEKLRQNPAMSYIHAVPAIFESICNKDRILSPPPLSVQLEITNICKTKCTICERYTWENEVRNNELSTPDIKKLLNDLSNFGVETVTLSGGEPLIRSDFNEILEFANSSGLKIGILTNGLHFNKQSAEAVVRYAAWVRISMDGSNKKLYEETRGVNGFSKVLDAFELIKKAKRKYSDSDCQIGICYVIQRLNIEEDIHNMIKHAKSIDMNGLNIDSVVFKFAHGRNGFLCSIKQLRKFDEDVLKDESFLHDKLSNLSYLKKFMSNYSSLENIAEGKPLEKFYKKHKLRCFTPCLFSLIDAFGDIYPCCFLYEDNSKFAKYKSIRERYKLGNIKEKTFKEIWHSDRYQQIRSDLKVISIERFPECAECTRHYLHNAFLTELFELYKDLIEEYGSKEGHKIFQEVVKDSSKYPPGIVWL